MNPCDIEYLRIAVIDGCIGGFLALAVWFGVAGIYKAIEKWRH